VAHQEPAAVAALQAVQAGGLAQELEQEREFALWAGRS